MISRYIITQGLLYWYYFIKNEWINHLDSIEDLKEELKIAETLLDTKFICDIRKLDEEYHKYLIESKFNHWRTFVKYIEDTVGSRL